MDLESTSESHEGGIELAPGVRVPAKAIRMQFSRSGGPGGQNVNKLNTKAELWVAVDSLSGMRFPALQRLRQLAGQRLTAGDEIHITAETSRSQDANRQQVLLKLRQLLIEAMHQPKIRRPTRPSAGSVRRRLDTKRARSQAKQQRKRPEM